MGSIVPGPGTALGLAAGAAIGGGIGAATGGVSGAVAGTGIKLVQYIMLTQRTGRITRSDQWFLWYLHLCI